MVAWKRWYLELFNGLDARLGWETRKVFPRAASFHLELPEADSTRTLNSL